MRQRARLILVLGALLSGCAPMRVAGPCVPEPSGRVDFASQVRPILQAKCSPCHFEGGKMYERLPFDREATIRELGERLFTRIQAEEDRTVIRAFLATPPR